jgi:hypothetical protein
MLPSNNFSPRLPNPSATASLELSASDITLTTPRKNKDDLIFELIPKLTVQVA